MRLNDFKGKRGMGAMAGLMRLAESVSGSGEFKAFQESVRQAEGDTSAVLSAFFALAPLLEDKGVQDGLVSVVAQVRGLDPDEVAEEGDLLGEVAELLTSDVGAVRFLSR